MIHPDNFESRYFPKKNTSKEHAFIERVLKGSQYFYALFHSLVKNLLRSKH